jgi:hypothetical protein
MKRIFFALAALAVIASTQLATSGTALAHETRQVGPYKLVVGWLNEPAYQGMPNAATIRVSDTRVDPAKPVEGIEKTLSIKVFSGGLTTPFTGELRAVHGQKGLYALDLIPTVAGSYHYEISGKIEDMEINEIFESGPGRFNDVAAQTELQYPVAVAAGSDLGESLADLKASIDRVQLIALGALAAAVLLPLGVLLISKRG